MDVLGALRGAHDELVDLGEREAPARGQEQVESVPEELLEGPVPVLVARALSGLAIGHLEDGEKELDQVLGEAGAASWPPRLVVEEIEAMGLRGREDDQRILASRRLAVALPERPLVGFSRTDEAPEAGA